MLWRYREQNPDTLFGLPGRFQVINSGGRVRIPSTVHLRELKHIFHVTKKVSGVMLGHSQNLGQIGSAVLTFIGYKRTNKQTDKQSICIDKQKINFRDLIAVLFSTIWIK